MKKIFEIDKESAIPLQKQLQAVITSQVESGVLKPGTRIPSERELAELYGVSRATSKGAVMALLNEGVVTRTPGKGTFIREDIGLNDSRATRHKNVAFVLSHAKDTRFAIDRDPVFFSVLNGIHEYSEKKSNHVLFQYVDGSSHLEVESFRALLSKVDGVILGSAENDIFTKILEREGVPHVLVFPMADFADKVIVNWDHRRIARTGVMHLVESGHTDIALIGGPAGDTAADLRHQGALDVFKSSNISVRDSWVVRSDVWWLIPDGHRAANRILDSGPKPTAIFCANDLLAVGALKACAERNILVPEDISIVGCDNTILAENSIPQMTSVDTYKEVLGKLAADHLFSLIEDPDFPPVATMLPVRLVERDSVRHINGLRT